jgi:thiol-disulfide isomerase/thioredoxin
MRKFAIIILVLIGINSCTNRERTCTISGKVIGRPQSKNLLLVKAFGDLRGDDVKRIPIIDSAFTFSLNFNTPEVYSLVFEDEYMANGWFTTYFFVESGEVKIELYSEDKRDMNTVWGAPINKEFSDFQKKWIEIRENRLTPFYDKLNDLIDNNNYDSDTVKVLKDLINKSKTQEERSLIYKQLSKLRAMGLNMSEPAKVINDSLKIEVSKIRNELLDHIDKKRTIVSYYLLSKEIDGMSSIWDNRDNSIVIDKLKTLQSNYSRLYPHHPYTRSNDMKLWNIEHIRVGGNLFDFTLADTVGNSYTLSNEIRGKIAFIDIWAPWCAPCIATSRSMKPVYEQFKDKGFTVIGVASKFKTLESVKNILRKDSYPWITLIDEPSFESEINIRYGIENAGGGTFLIDKIGTILAINPTSDEVIKILSENLK